MAYEDDAVLLASVSKKVLSATRRGIMMRLSEVIHRHRSWGHSIRAQKVDRAGRNRPARADAETGKRHTMNILLWVLQVLAALLYGSSGVMKVFMFDKVSQDVPSFGAMPRKAWMTLGILELVCTVGLIVPDAFHWQPQLTILAATVLAVESLVFVGVHVKYREVAPTILSAVLGLLMAFIAYGRMVLQPIL
jgi:uncharacterized membrane protein YphA (DoxX/SURF4 family)